MHQQMKMTQNGAARRTCSRQADHIDWGRDYLTETRRNNMVTDFDK